MGHHFLPDRPVDEEASLAAVAAGGIPFRAQRRIAELQGGQSAFTSMLSPAETTVARSLDLTPLSQVVGSSLYHVGWVFSGTSYTGAELTTLSHAYFEGRRLALSRLAQEATILGAHAVVGVKLTQVRHAWAGDTVEFNASGTAVRLANTPLPALPALAMMEVDELYKLHGAGYWPVGIAIGCCFWYQPHADCVSDGSWWSSPLPAHDSAIHECTKLARERFRSFTEHLGADGVVGVKYHRAAHDHVDDNHTNFSCEIMLSGTAVVRHGKPRTGERPMRVLDLRDRVFSDAAKRTSHR